MSLYSIVCIICLSINHRIARLLHDYFIIILQQQYCHPKTHRKELQDWEVLVLCEFYQIHHSGSRGMGSSSHRNLRHQQWGRNLRMKFMIEKNDSIYYNNLMPIQHINKNYILTSLKILKSVIILMLGLPYTQSRARDAHTQILMKFK